MVQAVVQAAGSAAKLRVPFKEVRASRGKVVRAEPVAALYDQGKIHHVGNFPALEDELVAFSTVGYLGDGSPDRADALIWALSEIFPRVVYSDEKVEPVEVLGRPLLRGSRWASSTGIRRP